MKKPAIFFTALFILTNSVLLADLNPMPNKKSIDKSNVMSPNVNRTHNPQSAGGAIGSSGIQSDKSFNIIEHDQNGIRPTSISNNIITTFPISDGSQVQLGGHLDVVPDYRNLIYYGINAQISQSEDGTLWTAFEYDIGGPYSAPDGFTDMVIFYSIDNGFSWSYWNYIYATNVSVANIDVESLNDRLVFVYNLSGEGTNDLRVFWIKYDVSDYASLGFTLPDGFDTFEWGSVLADKFYYAIESTWVYVTFSVWNSETGNGGIFYARSTTYGESFDNQTMMWQESDHLADPWADYYIYRGGLNIAYSTAEPFGPVDYVWTALSVNATGDIHAAKLDIYTNEVITEVVMQGDAFNKHYAPVIAAYYTNVGIFTSTSWLDGYGYQTANNDVAMTFTYDEGGSWGEDFAWYYWGDAEDNWDYSVSPNFALDGGLGFAYAAQYEVGGSFESKVNFRTNTSTNFLNGWGDQTLVNSGLTSIFKIGSVIQDGYITLVYDNTDYSSLYEVYAANYPMDAVVTGTVAGYVTNAVNGGSVSGAEVTIAGQTVYTDASGYYVVYDVSPAALEASFFAQPLEGNAPLDVQFYNLTTEGGTSITVEKDGYATYYDNTLEVVPDQTTNYNVSLSPLDDNWIRFVLNWGAEPTDLDIHLITESGEHIYYGNTGDPNMYPYATLDNDVTSGYGPETITITQSSPEGYKLYVYNYSQDPSITTSGAVLQAYSYGQPAFTVNVPVTGNGEYWHVADVNGQTNTYNLVNTIQQSAPEFEGGGGDQVIGVDILTDNYPSETTWEIADYYTGAIVASGGPLDQQNALFQWDVDVPTSDYTFTIYDAYGDGICCSYGEGYYAIYANGTEIAYSQFSGSSESVYISFTRGSGGEFTISRTHYLEPVPFSKGTTLDQAFVDSWPTSDPIEISSGTFGDVSNYPEPKSLSLTRDISFTWDFGDGYTSNDENPMHTYNSAGTYSVSLLASDGANSSVYQREGYIVVTGGGENNPPVVTNPIGSVSLAQGESFSLNLNNVFSDPDGDVLAFDVVNGNPGVVNASISGYLLNLVGVSGGSATVTVYALDASGAFVTDEVSVTVEAGNSSPFVLNDPPDMELIIGQEMEVDLNGIFIDPDGDEMTFSATSSNSEILLAGVDANFLTLAPQSVGYSEVYVTADDGNGGSASTMFVVTVVEPGGGGYSAPPVLYEFPTIVLNEDESSDPILLDDYVTDEDTPISSLFWFTSGVGSPHVMVHIDPLTHHLTVHGMHHWNGDTHFSILVSDGQNLAMGTVQIMVNPVDDPPTIIPITGITFMEDMTFPLNVSDYVHDVDTDLADLDISYVSGGDVTAEMDTGTGHMHFAAPADWNGQETGHLHIGGIYDLHGNDFLVVVVPVNDPPVFTSLAYPEDMDVVEDYELSFGWEEAVDVDVNDVLEYHLSVFSDESLTQLVQESVTGAELTALMTFNESGTYYWNVIVTDSENESSLSETRTFTIETVMSADPMALLPDNFELFQNYPNPFNPSTEIRYNIPEATFVKIKVYDMVGKEIITLLNHKVDQGSYKANWNGKDKMGNQVSGGVYIYTIETPKYNSSKKMILLK